MADRVAVRVTPDRRLERIPGPGYTQPGAAADTGAQRLVSRELTVDLGRIGTEVEESASGRHEAGERGRERVRDVDAERSSGEPSSRLTPSKSDLVGALVADVEMHRHPQLGDGEDSVHHSGRYQHQAGHLPLSAQ